MTRRSPSEQNQSGKSEPKSPFAGGNQQVPQAAGNPRYNNPGVDPSPDPKIVVKAVNPPVTPDQVVGMAEMPSAATLDLPKIQNIKIPPVKNKTIQGHLKAIEAKMNATEKLMKDVVKLQKLQIITEKELFERKRELYQNTFEEYLLDKTVDFGDRDGPGGVNAIKKGPGGFGFPFGGGRRRKKGRPPGGAPGGIIPPAATEKETESETAADRMAQGQASGLPNLGTDYKKQEQDAIKKAEDWRRQQEQETGVAAPGKKTPKEQEAEAVPETPAVPAPAPMRFPPGLPILDPKFVPPFIIPDVISMPGVPATPPIVTIPGYDMRVKTHQQELAHAIETYIENNPGSEFDVKLERGARVDTGHLIKKRDGKVYIHEPLTQEQLTLLTAANILNLSQWMPVVPRARTSPVRTGPGLSSPKYTPPVRRAPIPQAPVNNKVPTNRPAQGAPVPAATVTPKQSVTGILDQRRGSISSTAASFRAQSSASQADFGRDLATDSLNQRSLQQAFQQGNQGGRRIRKVLPSKQQAGVFFETNMNAGDLIGSGLSFGPRPLSTKEKLLQMRQPSFDQYTSPIGPMPRASGGMGDVDLYSSQALNYFRGMSSKIMPMASGGFMTTNEKAEHYMKKMLNQALGVARRYDEAKAKAADVQTTTGSVVIPKSGGGLVGWWNKGRNMRVPSENTASWKDLMKDDAKQITRTNKAFKSGATGIKGWNPIKAFTPEMVRTGPTPAVRQAFERPARTVTHPLMMALEFIVNDLLLNPRSTAVYDQVTGPNAYYNDPAYKGPMPSQNLENAQSSMMSGNNDQKPEVVPLPPDYIKIPGKNKAPDFVGDNSPDIFMRTSIFTRNQTDLD